MGYVVYVWETGAVVSKRAFKSQEKAEMRAAELKAANSDKTFMVCTETDASARTHDVKMVTRENLMSGKKFVERADTPTYCSPAFESYWSM